MSNEFYAAMSISFKPNKVKVVLLAESPPAIPQDADVSEFKYFYNVAYINNQKDSLLRETAKVVLKNNTLSVRTKEEKLAALNGVKDAGIFLVDVVKYPINKLNSKKERKQAITGSIPALIGEIQELNPERVIIALKSVYDLVKSDLKKAGLPIIEIPIYSPWYNCKKYKDGLRQALWFPRT